MFAASEGGGASQHVVHIRVRLRLMKARLILGCKPEVNDPYLNILEPHGGVVPPPLLRIALWSDEASLDGGHGVRSGGGYSPQLYCCIDSVVRSGTR